MTGLPHVTDQAARARRMRPVWITAAGLAISLALTSAIFFREIEGQALLPGNILLFTFININVILVLVLLLLLSRNFVKLYFERRHKLLGAGFRTKLVAAFVGLTLIPSFFLFVIATGLINSSIENWFGIPVDQSLKNSLDVAQEYYEATKERVTVLGRNIGNQSSSLPPTAKAQKRLLDTVIESPLTGHDITQLSIYGSDGRLMARRPPTQPTEMAPQQPETTEVDTRLAEAFAGTESLTTTPVETGEILHAVFPIFSDGRVRGVVVVEALIPLSITGKLDDINRAMEDYRQLKTLKTPIKGVYMTLLLGVAMLIVFAAMWFGFYIARSVTGPIQKLVDGTRAVAAGDLSVRVEAESTDELRDLVASFNTMTSDLRLNKQQIDAVNRSLRHSNIELEQRRAYIETVLETIATGVIATDQDGRITTWNRSAERILQVAAGSVKGRRHEEVFKNNNLGPLITDIHQLQRRAGGTIERDLQVEVRGRFLTLRFSLALLRGEQEEFLGAVLVFDDLSELIKAQKLAAWQEVARRIAHEIKNPLTPILLATERLRKKYRQDSGEFDAIFDESTKIVIDEVNALKTMVDEFSNFARMPMPSLSPGDLHVILREAVFLYRSAHREVEVITQLAPLMPTLLLDAAQIKQVFINLFENAVAAMQGQGRLWVSTRYESGQPMVTVCVSDEGIGIAPEDVDKLFLPHFSKRRGGTGLGLAIVHRIIADHNGHIRVEPNLPRGTTITVELPVSTLS